MKFTIVFIEITIVNSQSIISFYILNFLNDAPKLRLT
jgi:hypothetical protein